MITYVLTGSLFWKCLVIGNSLNWTTGCILNLFTKIMSKEGFPSFKLKFKEEKTSFWHYSSEGYMKSTCVVRLNEFLFTCCLRHFQKRALVETYVIMMQNNCNLCGKLSVYLLYLTSVILSFTGCGTFFTECNQQLLKSSVCGPEWIIMLIWS